MLTIEASICVPVFIFLILLFYGILIMFMGQQMLVHTVFQMVQSLTLDSYATDMITAEELSDGEEVVNKLYEGVMSTGADSIYFTSTEKWYAPGSKLLPDVVKNRFIGYFAGDENKADILLKMIGVQNGVDGLNLEESRVEGDVLKIKLKYRQEFLYNFQGLAAFDREISVQADMWRWKN